MVGFADILREGLQSWRSSNNTQKIKALSERIRVLQGGLDRLSSRDGEIQTVYNALKVRPQISVSHSLQSLVDFIRITNRSGLANAWWNASQDADIRKNEAAVEALRKYLDQMAAIVENSTKGLQGKYGIQAIEIGKPSAISDVVELFGAISDITSDPKNQKEKDAKEERRQTNRINNVSNRIWDLRGYLERICKVIDEVQAEIKVLPITRLLKAGRVKEAATVASRMRGQKFTSTTKYLANNALLNARDIETAAAALKCGADINIKDLYKRNLVEIQWGNEQFALWIVSQRGFNAYDLKFRSGLTLLQEAAKDGRSEIVGKLLQKRVLGSDVDVLYRTKDINASPYVASVLAGFVSCFFARHYLNQYYHTAWEIAHGNGVLFGTFLSGVGAAVITFIGLGLYAYKNSQTGTSALHLAAIEGDKATYDLLLKKGANATIVDEHGHLASYYADKRTGAKWTGAVEGATAPEVIDLTGGNQYAPGYGGNAPRRRPVTRGRSVTPLGIN